MTTTVRIQDDVLIPPDVQSIDAFRRWMRSDNFPARGRIDYIDSNIEVDLSPEELRTHGGPKADVFAYIHRVVTTEDLGEVFVDRARLSSEAASLSCEPEIVFVSWESLRSGAVEYRRWPGGGLMEIHGAADLVVEVVSDTTESKDRVRLPGSFARAGVPEYWLVDARGETLLVQIRVQSSGQYEPAPTDEAGYQQSKVLDRWLRASKRPGQLEGSWRVVVQERGLST